MNPKLTRLVLAAVLFAVWMGYLVYLVHTLPRSPNDHDWLSQLLRPEKPNDLPLTLSRPQLLVSQVDVVGRINLDDGTVNVKDVLYPPKADTPAKGEEIKVTNLGEVKPTLKNQANLGDCLLPLQKSEDGKTYRVAPVPPSPGYTGGDARVYPANAETLAEYHTIHKKAEE